MFSQLFSAFPKYALSFEHLKKKMILMACLFLNLRTPKNVVREMSKKSCLRGSFDRKHGKRAKTIIQYQRQHLYQIHWSLSWKKWLLGSCKVLRAFVNTPTVDDKYSLLSRDNLMQEFRWIYLKIFPSFFVYFWNLQKILNIFKKDDPHNLYISESTDAEIGG